MKSNIPTEWLHPSNLEEAQYVQRQLANRIILEDDFLSCELLGGMDVSNNLYDPHSMIYASTIVLDKHTLRLEEESTVAQVQTFPYISGFLGFREAPALIEAFRKLKKRPDILLIDGHGISHPRHLGIASHVGVLLDIPTIGVAKSILVGHPSEILGNMKGDKTPLMRQGKQIGVVLRTKARSNPMIISVGHRISLESAVKIVVESLTRYRLPEPTRQAHLSANRTRKEYMQPLAQL